MSLLSFEKTRNFCIQEGPWFIYDPTCVSYIQYMFNQLDYYLKTEIKDDTLLQLRTLKEKTGIIFPRRLFCYSSPYAIYKMLFE